jgi:putative CocE/NonD family hydrolase
MLSTESIKLDINVPIKMRDGAIIYSDVWRPDTGGKYPTILTRTPYNKNFSFPTRAGYLNPQRFVRAGYAVVIQDVRGTSDSDGPAFYWQQETADGYDSVEYIAQQPWCDGTVGMYGISYFGYTQWAAAVAQPPHLVTICPAMTSMIPYAFPFSRKGDTFKLDAHLSWCLGQLLAGLAARKLPRDEMESVLDSLVNLLDNKKEQLLLLPLKDSPAAKLIDKLGMMPTFADIVDHVDNTESWQSMGNPLPVEKVTIPVLHISGWYDDDMIVNVLASYKDIKERGGSELAKQNQRMLIGPWTHSTDLLNVVGELDFGQRASGAMVDVTGVHIRWFDHWLKNIQNGIMNEPPIRFFSMGRNVWRNEKEWPPSGTTYIKFYLHSGGMANSLSGDGSLSREIPGSEQPDSFLYDPRNPVPSNELGQGAFNQQIVETRPDILVYTSDMLKTDLDVSGPVTVSFWAATSAPDTDFSLKLVDVWPNGRAYNIMDGVVRASSCQGKRPLKSGQPYHFSLELGATSNVFKSGHKIRIEISSSNFPKRARNLNSGRPVGQDAEISLALQSVFHNEQYPSHILLPTT